MGLQNGVWQERPWIKDPKVYAWSNESKACNALENTWCWRCQSHETSAKESCRPKMKPITKERKGAASKLFNMRHEMQDLEFALPGFGLFWFSISSICAHSFYLEWKYLFCSTVCWNCVICFGFYRKKQSRIALRLDRWFRGYEHS